ncbi:hypothetical protein NL676_025546 [Syzygium grande]|nr:hypothetical protein NL676_025546 [Syzygium grande]
MCPSRVNGANPEEISSLTCPVRGAKPKFPVRDMFATWLVNGGNRNFRSPTAQAGDGLDALLFSVAKRVPEPSRTVADAMAAMTQKARPPRPPHAHVEASAEEGGEGGEAPSRDAGLNKLPWPIPVWELGGPPIGIAGWRRFGGGELVKSLDRVGRPPGGSSASTTVPGRGGRGHVQLGGGGGGELLVFDPRAVLACFLIIYRL